MKEPDCDWNAAYWDSISERYRKDTRISCSDFHYGPLLAGDSELGLLPENVGSLKCLELGCGAAQNSIYLSKLGAKCTALDVSRKQLALGSALAAKAGVDIEFVQRGMEDLSCFSSSSFNLVHSSYALDFSSDPESVFRETGRILVPGGTFLFSTGHPLCSGEWIDLDGDKGVFLKSYFNPEPDCRKDFGNISAVSRSYPIGWIISKLAENGLALDMLAEPRALDVPFENAPYWSPAWDEWTSRFHEFPVTAIYLCRRTPSRP